MRHLLSDYQNKEVLAFLYIHGVRLKSPISETPFLTCIMDDATVSNQSKIALESCAPQTDAVGTQRKT